MSKKDFSGGLGALLKDKPTAKETTASKTPAGRGRPKGTYKVVASSSQQGTKEGETRATFIIQEELLQAIKDIAYWERLKIKDVLQRALEVEVARYEKQNGPIKPTP